VGTSNQPQCLKCEVPTFIYNHNTFDWKAHEIYQVSCLPRQENGNQKQKDAPLHSPVCHTPKGCWKPEKYISVEILLANITYMLQPMDQGIFRALKQKFQRNLVLRFLQTSFNCSQLETVLAGCCVNVCQVSQESDAILRVSSVTLQYQMNKVTTMNG